MRKRSSFATEAVPSSVDVTNTSPSSGLPSARTRVQPSPIVSGATGCTLIERTLRELSGETDHRISRAVEWDSRLVELSAAVKSRIPPLVEERSRAARIRSNCGLLGEARHAWVSADSVLHIWDYRQDNPQVLVLPADSAIISVTAGPPKPGVFAGDVHLLLVICTRASVSLVGLSLIAAAPPLGALSSSNIGNTATPSLGGLGGVSSTGSLRLVPLDGFSAPTNGALFHCVSHTADGHILLACGAPQLYELAYSRTPSLFHTKCRLIRHASGLWARVRNLLPLSPNSGRIRFVQCAPHSYAFSVDDANTLRLFRIRDHSVNRAESVAVLEELAMITISELAAQHFAMSKQHMTSHLVTHVFPVIGLDGHLRVRVITSASERLLILCSSTSPGGPAAGPTVDTDATAGAQASKGRYYGFWLQRYTESRLGHGGAASTGPADGSAVVSAGGWASTLMGGSAGASRRVSCLEERCEPCTYANGVWVAAAHRSGVAATEVGVTVRIEDTAGITTGGVPELVNLFASLSFDCHVLQIVEESDMVPGFSDGTASMLREGSLSNGGRLVEVEGDQPSDFRATRTFALFLENSVQVVRLCMRAQSLRRPPATSAECCMHLVQLGRPLTSAGGGNASSQSGMGSVSWQWSFDDIGFPSFDAQMQQLQCGRGVPSVCLGRWLCGLLRFLAIVLRPVWDQPIVIPAQDANSGSVIRNYTDGLCLAFSEGIVRQLLSQLRPALQFARSALRSAEAHRESSTTLVLASKISRVAARSRLYSTERSLSSEGVAQAKKVLGEVLDVADHAQQVLGLLSVLHSQRCAYRVLQSSILAGGAVQSLLKTPLRELVASQMGLEPVVQLCSALVMESGLTTPAAELIFDSRSYPRPMPTNAADLGMYGTSKALSSSSPSGDCNAAAGLVCRELEGQCPLIFAHVDLSFLRKRLGVGTIDDRFVASRRLTGASVSGASPSSTSPDAAGELIRRYAQCVGVASDEACWRELARGVEKMAAEDPRGAVDLCVDKLQQLEASAFAGSEGNAFGSATACAKLLVEALLSELATDRHRSGLVDRNLATRALVEHLLTKTASLTFQRAGLASAEGAMADIPPVHTVILGCLLQNERLHPVLEGLLEAGAANAEGFLEARLGTDRSVGEILWRHHVKRQRFACAMRVLLRLAEQPDPGVRPEERVQYMVLARQAASQDLPRLKEDFDRIGLQLEVALDKRKEEPAAKTGQKVSTSVQETNPLRKDRAF